MSEAIAERFAAVRTRIREACERAGRAPQSVQLLAASKYQPEAAIRAAYAQGQRLFGENYVQELVAKSAALADLPDLRWHLIGKLQTNKAKDVLRVGAAVQSLDSLKLCQVLAERAQHAQHHERAQHAQHHERAQHAQHHEHAQQVEVFVQVNISDEPQKAGIALDELPQLVAAIRAHPTLQLRGFMTLPKPSDDPEALRPAFQRMKALALEHQVAELSMGMSDDLEVAIAEGATMVRVGTALFGARPQP